MKKRTPLAARYASRAELDARVALALKKAKEEEKKSRLGSVKRKPVEVLARYLALSPKSGRCIRPADAFRTRSHNLGTQIVDLIDHLFVGYRPPRFLYETMLSPQGKHQVFGNCRERSHNDERRYREWFRTISLGFSFADIAIGTLTKKQAHWFLLAPSGNDIETNIIWAKVRHAGLAENDCDRFVARFDPTACSTIGDRLPELIRFYQKYANQMRDRERDLLDDYVRAAHEDERFSMRGRTLASIRRLSRDWHRYAWGYRYFTFRAWEPAIPLWEKRVNRFLVRAIELSDNRALAAEGEKQRHCVVTYAEDCVRRDCRIVSMRWFFPGNGGVSESTRLTIEVWNRTKTVVQVRGRNNRDADDAEKAAVRRWADDVGLKVSDWAF